MAILYMMIGIPGSGKSTVAERLLEKKYGAYVVSTDTLRHELLGNADDQSQNGKIHAEARNRVLYALRAGKDACHDATNIKAEHRAQLLNEMPENTITVGVLCECEIPTALRRQLGRDRRVPEHVIRRMAWQLEIPTLQEFNAVMHISETVVLP